MVYEEFNIEENEDMKEETFESKITKRKEKKNTSAVHIMKN